jgi:nucleoid-associated protein YgaU
MERVTFLVERTGDRIPCLLNPESLEVRRSAGLVRRRSAGGAVIGNPRTDDPLVATGGGVTEYELKLLFDVDLLAGQSPSEGIAPLAAATAAPPPESTPAGLEGVEETGTGNVESPADVPSAPPAEEAPAAPVDVTPPAPAAPQPTIDVRTLTQPLWALAENGEPVAGSLAPQRVRFVWGRSWNVPGVILAVAERLERFDPQGVPQRSWLSLLMRRVEEELEGGDAPPPPTSPQFEVSSPGSDSDDSGDESVVIPVDEDGTAMTPLYLVAAERYGDARYDRAIAEYNDLDDLLEMEEGQTIRLPPSSSVAGAA